MSSETLSEWPVVYDNNEKLNLKWIYCSYTKKNEMFYVKICVYLGSWKELGYSRTVLFILLFQMSQFNSISVRAWVRTNTLAGFWH